MSKFFSLTLDLLSYDAAVESNDPADADKIKKTISENISIMSRSNPVSVLPAAVDQIVPLASGACNYLVIFTDQTITIKLNSDPNPLTLTPVVAGKKTPVFFQRGNITSLTISNSGATAANVDVISAQL